MPKRNTQAPWERRSGESAQAFAAFSAYLEMGPERSLQAVSQKLGKSKALMERWSSAHGWVERCWAWDDHLQREARKAAVQEVREMNRRHIQLASTLQATALQAIQESGADIIDQKNLAPILKLATALERESREAEVTALGGSVEADERQNNLLAAILDTEEIDTDDLPEVE